MKKIIVYSIVLLSLLCVPSVVNAQSTMTDQQVLEYVKSGLAAGKSQKTLLQELVLKGVDRAQAARVRKLYENRMGGADAMRSAEAAAVSAREHIPNGESANDVDPTASESFSYAGNDAVLPDAEDEVYGRNIFRNRTLNFAPSTNTPTPKNYVLGAGDEVIVDVFGANQSTIRNIISPEGYINLDFLGPIYLAGKTIEQANVYLKNKLSQIYDGLNGGEEATDIQLSLGQIRSIQINVVGEVQNPGTYLISSLSTALHAMFRAGGVVEPGTIRSIKVVRDNKTISTLDIYELLINGSRKSDVRLEEGDVILVEPYKSVVKVSGYVKRPMNFEMKDGESLADVLKYAGGFSKAAFTGNVSVIRQTNHDYVVTVVESSQYSSFKLQNGDEIEVKKMEARFENRISITGAVYLPGLYELNNDVNSVRKLVKKAGGLMPEAFTERALIHRQREDKSLETFAVDLAGIMNGTKGDVALQNNDELAVNSVIELNDYGTLIISGEVAAPDTFAYAANTTVLDLILQAGGLLRSASTVRVDVARKIVDQESLVAQSDIAKYYTFSIQNGFAVDGADSFILEPYDVVTVRRSPSFVENKTVGVLGEVNFPGYYAMSKREERISDLVKKSGNVTDFAYLKGARLTRRMTKEERLLYGNVLLAVKNEGDSVMDETLERTYLVSFDMEDAIENPGGINDLVLRDGDVLEVPVYMNTVRIDGAVQLPTVIAYQKGLSKRDLVNAAGGYAKRAYKRKAFVVYVNGRTSRLKRFTNIEPGCQIFIPKKEKKENRTAEILSISTTAASLGMMGVSIANLLK